MSASIQSAEHAPRDKTRNPMGTDGFEFVEYAVEDTRALGRLFEQMGFRAAARHRSKNVTLYRQGDINFIVNAERDSFAQSFARLHGPSICAVALRVRDAAFALERALSLGATPFHGRVGPMELNIPAIKGVGESLIYLVDRYPGHPVPSYAIYDVDFVPIAGAEPTSGSAGLTDLDHLTHNVYRGRMNLWARFYETLFNFAEVRYFDIEGQLTGLRSRAMVSPCGRIRIPINESADDRSQIEEYLQAYHGEGIQHVALGTDNIYGAVEILRARGVPFMEPPPDSYYEAVDDRLPGHGEDLARLKQNGILIDGAPGSAGTLLQIFTATLIGPIFFEIIQRKGAEGFGEGNFRALFEAIERDQIRRGALQAQARSTP